MVNITSRLPLESVLRSPLFPPCDYDIWCDKQFSRVRHAVNARIIAPISSKDHPLNFESYLLKDEHWAHQGNITMNIIKRAIYWCSNSNSGANSNCQLLVAHCTSLRFSPLSIRWIFSLTYVVGENWRPHCNHMHSARRWHDLRVEYADKHQGAFSKFCRRSICRRANNFSLAPGNKFPQRQQRVSVLHERLQSSHEIEHTVFSSHQWLLIQLSSKHA